MYLQKGQIQRHIYKNAKNSAVSTKKAKYSAISTNHWFIPVAVEAMDPIKRVRVS